MSEQIDEQAQVCAFCKSDPEALAEAHEEGWRAGREHEQRETERIVAERLAAVESVCAIWDAEPNLPPAAYNVVDDVRAVLSTRLASTDGSER